MMMTKKGANDYWLYSEATKRWRKESRPKLNEVEKDILKLAAMGFGIEVMASKTGLTIEAIRSRRKSIFDKLGVNNISEAISFAKNYQLV